MTCRCRDSQIFWISAKKCYHTFNIIMSLSFQYFRYATTKGINRFIEDKSFAWKPSGGKLRKNKSLMDHRNLHESVGAAHFRPSVGVATIDGICCKETKRHDVSMKDHVSDN